METAKWAIKPVIWLKVSLSALHTLQLSKNRSVVRWPATEFICFVICIKCLRTDDNSAAKSRSKSAPHWCLVGSKCSFDFFQLNCEIAEQLAKISICNEQVVRYLSLQPVVRDDIMSILIIHAQRRRSAMARWDTSHLAIAVVGTPISNGFWFTALPFLTMELTQCLFVFVIMRNTGNFGTALLGDFRNFLKHQLANPNKSVTILENRCKQISRRKDVCLPTRFLLEIATHQDRETPNYD